MKTILNRIFKVTKLASNLHNLPENLLELNPLIIKLRFLGGTSILFILGNKYLNCPTYLLYLAIIFAIFFTIYQIILNYYRIIHILKIIKSDKLEVINSPLDRLVTLSAKSILYLKLLLFNTTCCFNISFNVMCR